MKKKRISPKKISFSFFILFFLALLVFFTSSFNNSIPFQKFLNQEKKLPIEENLYKDLDCFPFYPPEPTIILRLDDIGPNRYKGHRSNMIDEILERDMKVVISLIPYKLEEDRDLTSYLLKTKDNPNLEIAQHGYLHEQDEFKEKNLEEAKRALEKGLEIINSHLNIRPITFIPPSNEYSQDTIIALNQTGFKILSAKQGEYAFKNSIFHLGKTTQTYDFGYKKLISTEEVISSCKESLELTNFCVIMIHPQDYLIGGELDNNKYKEFITLLDKLQVMNVNFAVPRDLIYCN